MSSRATRPELLEQRIAENRASQEIDLPTWIFERLAVRSEDHVLELCCGTGGQTLRILELLGESGSILGLDVSGEALQTLASRVGGQHQGKLRLVEGSLDNLSEALEKSSGFDLIFCAYGLYYSSNAALTLTRPWAGSSPGAGSQSSDLLGQTTNPCLTWCGKAEFHFLTRLYIPASASCWRRFCPGEC